MRRGSSWSDRRRRWCGVVNRLLLVANLACAGVTAFQSRWLVSVTNLVIAWVIWQVLRVAKENRR